MCGIAGWVDFKEDLRDKRSILDRMVKTLEKNHPLYAFISFYIIENCIKK